MVETIALARLARWLGSDADRPLATHGGQASTRRDFLHRVAAWRAGFASAGGRRFALHVEDSRECAAALLGAWHADKVVYLAADTLAATLQSLAGLVDGYAGAFDEAIQPDPTAHPAGSVWQDLDPEAERLVLFTSGSSGDPVAIGKCLRQLDREIATLEARFGAQVGDARIEGTVSHQHIYGLLFRVLWPLASQRPFSSHRLEYPEQIAALDGTQPTVLVSSPALLKRLPDTLDWSGLRPALRVVFSSGGPLPDEARRLVDTLWAQSVIEVFGSTETGGIATRSSGGQAWEPLPGVQWKLEGDELHVRSSHLAQDAWYRTEDRARAVDDRFELLGRGDRLVKLEERRISLDAIERALRSDERISEARVVVLPGGRERIGAVVVLSAAGREQLASAGRRSLIDALRDVLRPQVDPIAIPRHWRLVEALPVNAQGKSTHRELVESFDPSNPSSASAGSEPMTSHLPPGEEPAPDLIGGGAAAPDEGQSEPECMHTRPLTSTPLPMGEGLAEVSTPMPHWHECNPTSAKLQVTAPGTLPVFDGHFPGTPILPGVALIDWAIAWGRNAFAIGKPFLRMEALKFQQLVRPETVLEVELGWRDDAGVLHFSYRSMQGMHASGRIVFADPQAAA